MKTFKSFATALVCALALGSCSQAQQQPQSVSERVDNYFAENPGKFSGAIEIQENGKTVYQKALGFADIENKIPATNKTKFRIGSISKTFTAVLTFKAVQEGKLSLTDPISKFFPDAQIPNAEQITVDMLLYHRSGLRDVVNDKFDEFVTYYTKPQTRAQMIERIAKAGTNFAPDSTFRYCNSGFILLTYIIEDVCGKSYDELLNEQIIKPLQLSYTGVCTTPINSNEGFAQSFSISGERLEEFDPSAVLGAGAMYSTPGDLLKFFNALTSGYFGNGIFEQMKDYKDNWGRGLFPMDYGDYKGFGHTGGIHGFAAVMMKIDDKTIVFGSNSSFSDATNLMNAILGIAPEPKPQYITLPAEQLKKCEGKYTCEQLKMDVEITSTGTQLMAQATGQPGFPLDAISETEFEFKAAGVKMVFDLAKHTFTLHQHGGEFIFKKTGEEEKPQYQAANTEQLSKYEGVYNSKALGMDITIAVKDGQLTGQGTGQPSFPLNATAENEFEFKPAGIVIRFDVDNNKLTLHQRGMEFELLKK
ncbi:MAG: serine hydrolase [Bacteroidales bacterium]|nr:serine hydrolase [Bacteroidales bacterium]